MEESAYKDYADESADWLKTARCELLAHLIEAHRPRAGALDLLEVGAGVGQNLPVLARFGRVDASEVNALGQRAIVEQGVAGALHREPLPFALDATYDVIVALDVIEHIEDDRAALRWVHEHLRPSGIFVATVPAYPWLFSDHDRALEHFRRYTKQSFCAALPADLRVVEAAYFNHLLFPAAVAARAAWSLGRTLRPQGSAKQPSPKSGPLSAVFRKVLAGELALMRAGYRPPWGLSVYCVARRG